MTREKAATILYKEWQRFLEHNLDYAGISDAYMMAINTLKQEPCKDILDKIRDEIMKLDDINTNYPMDRTIHISRNEVLKIIDKYRESEVVE